jgi:hypothetical protein
MMFDVGAECACDDADLDDKAVAKAFGIVSRQAA